MSMKSGMKWVIFKKEDLPRGYFLNMLREKSKLFFKVGGGMRSNDFWHTAKSPI